MKHTKKLWMLSVGSVLAMVMLGACAVTKPELPPTVESAGEKIVYPDYDGPRIPLAVLPMGLSERAAQRYPHLLEQSVGLGVHNLLTDALFQTKRFRFVEDKESVIKEAFNWQKLGASGMVNESQAIEIGKLLGARLVAYGEVFDYSEGKTDRISGASKTVTPITRVGVQIRMVDLETLEYIPASSIEYGRDWSGACQAAIESAVYKIVSRMPKDYMQSH